MAKQVCCRVKGMEAVEGDIFPVPLYFLVKRDREDVSKVHLSEMNRMHFVSASNLAFSLGGRGMRDSSGARSTGNTVLQRKNRN